MCNTCVILVFESHSIVAIWYLRLQHVFLAVWVLYLLLLISIYIYICIVASQGLRQVHQSEEFPDRIWRNTVSYCNKYRKYRNIYVYIYMMLLWFIMIIVIIIIKYYLFCIHYTHYPLINLPGEAEQKGAFAAEHLERHPTGYRFTVDIRWFAGIRFASRSGVDRMIFWYIPC